MPMRLKFYDVKAKQAFETDKYEVVTRGSRRLAVATSPFTGIKVYRFLGKAAQ
jgi:hypothetical protein